MRVIHARRSTNVREPIPLANSVSIQPTVKKRKVQNQELFLQQPIDFLSMGINNFPETPVNDEDSDYTTPLSTIFGPKIFKPITPIQNNGLEELKELLDDQSSKKNNNKQIFRLTMGIEKEPIFKVTPEISLQKITVERVLQHADKANSVNEMRKQPFARHFPASLLQGPNIIRKSQLAIKNRAHLTFE
ncbi:hypothetical protein TVAG_327120 [Trichomonas vaginalis G3]|uniref:Uncharacterized protein n=1 Tax=Trichomonas vaginalis (strain ATCC PRA-98 / G3) TaxID=412133 RepID=A2FTR4_TRIV3|nr:hypothetical protein TVAGG3_0165390 [Trichomonas vaginalis G3]EAX91703.1 hypothetical protein TVAG_327120 [Trichomonas vaginalis G3]KAI5548182.1 hypothetical protein TVAGG3_0165390 [Trichomonas vaginalis G3]|eukprot:XP_001304633.1 hypothetical protein [Trichomonas vaginalis G3]